MATHNGLVGMTTDGSGTGAEQRRLDEDARRDKNWKRWGPYLSERQWGTVREDYSPDGSNWTYLTFEEARSRAYRWGEDGLLGICDRECRLCFAVALWNGRDPILKERLFGLSNVQGNHGEDVKEEYFYLDSTPTHSYFKALYKYPQAEFPYERLVRENANRGHKDPEFELKETGVFDEDRYFDVLAEYAKASPDDLLIRLTVTNRGPETAMLHVLPTLWFRNTWAWGAGPEASGESDAKPRLSEIGEGAVLAEHPTLGRFIFRAAPFDGVAPEMLYTENESNLFRLFNAENYYSNVKDAFHDYIVRGRTETVASDQGTKAAANYGIELPAGASVTLRMRLCPETMAGEEPFGPEFSKVFRDRIREANQFYAAHLPAGMTPEERNITRQAYAGLFWSKQFYHYVVNNWLEGDPAQPVPPRQRLGGRNRDWRHLYNRDVISVPDKWEYPYYAAWDLAFHAVAYAPVDPLLAKEQLTLMLREWYMHPNGQMPAYEFDFSDVNPPVHAWACWRVYKMTGQHGRRDTAFLARSFQKLLINFTWWVNRKDLEGRHLFAGGFLGLDNIGVFDRSRPLPDGARLDQADGTAWMAFFCGTMLSMALELAAKDPVYEDVASKFFEHFIAIIDAMNTLGGSGLWDEEDGYYYDRLSTDGRVVPLRLRSMVGLIPLLACEVLEEATIAKLPGFSKRMRWFIENRPDLARHISPTDNGAAASRGRRLLAVPSRDRLERVLRRVLDETELLSPFGIRSLSKAYQDKPYVFRTDGRETKVRYAPGESDSNLFGGNSNWRGPVWFPLNYLLIESLQRYHHFYGDDFMVECPTGSGNRMNLAQVADEISRRLVALFLPGSDGRRPCFGDDPRFASERPWKELLLFHEYFHGETGKGLGASHQTGWTALVARLMHKLVSGGRATAHDDAFGHPTHVSREPHSVPMHMKSE